ncbi:MAG: type II toxin-antitoxin system prevent-host-death family antitoxin [Burkholderiaceae bacterium]|nr:type II toxin-antitoxin system prevent-host-death family antitoxin [Burkholderiaceae bacterium]
MALQYVAATIRFALTVGVLIVKADRVELRNWSQMFPSSMLFIAFRTIKRSQINIHNKFVVTFCNLLSTISLVTILESAMFVSVRELKASLSHVLSLAQRGEIIEVTSHNKPIARVMGIPKDTEVGLSRLIAVGGLTWGGGKPKLASPIALVSGGKTLSKMVLEDRE